MKIQVVGVIEPSNEVGKHGLIIGKTLVRTDPRSYVPVRVMNVTGCNKRLTRDDEIAVCSPVDHILACETVPDHNDKRNRMKCSQIQVLLQTAKTSLEPMDYKKAEKLIKEYCDIIAIDEEDNGKTKVVEHRIRTGRTEPIRQLPRRLPLAKREEAREMLEKMKKQGVIEPSNSPWSSPVVLVRKKDNSLRFCVDYRMLNDVTQKDSYPLPRIDDTIDTLAGSRMFSTLDLKSGYWQVGIHPQDREKTAFSIGEGLWQFTVMPFGLCNAPATFERLMEYVLQGLNWRTCLVYLDDIIVVGKTFEEHLRNLGEVFQRIRKAGMKLNPTKCALFKSKVKYLGHIVSAEGVGTDPEKIKAVNHWPVPQSSHELRSFLGLCTYYRRFVANFSSIAKELYKLTERSAPFVWTESCQRAFEKLKNVLSSTPVLSYPIPEKEFILDTDASNEGIGAVLSQLVDGNEKVVAYFSRTLSKPERNYCVTRRELLAMVESIKHFHKYLYGRKFLLRTDHAALRWLLNFKNPEEQIARWIERLQSYEFEIQHRKGEQHKNADALSRRPCNTECKYCVRMEGKEANDHCFQVRFQIDDTWSDEIIREEQLQDSDIGPILRWIEEEKKPDWQEIAELSPVTKSYWAQWDSLKVVNGSLKRIWETPDGSTNILQLIIPQVRVSEVLQQMHSGVSGGHLGVNKTLDKIRQRFYWVYCKMDVEEWCRKCDICAASKGPHAKTRGQLQTYNVGSPFERIAIDLAGPFPVSKSGNKYILVVIDYFTKWPEVFAIPNQEAVTVANAVVDGWVSRYGVPMELHSDQGRNFDSQLFREMCRVLGIHKTRTTPLHPQSDGMVERFNRTIQQHLSKMVGENQADWDKHIPLFLMAYRGSAHNTTEVTPSKMLFGRELRLPCDLMFGSPGDTVESEGEYAAQLRARLNKIHLMARNRIRATSDRMKTRYDRRANMKEFQENDLVWFYNPQRRIGKSPKLQQDWEGPYRIIKKINDVIYRIQKGPRTKMKVIHVDRLAKYFGGDKTVRDEQD